MGSMSAGSKGGVIGAWSMQDNFPIGRDQRWTPEQWLKGSHREEGKISLGGERVTHGIPPHNQELVLVYGIVLPVREQL